MSVRLGSVVEKVRDPEYTGENRCSPCTVLNIALLLVLTVALALYVPIGAAIVLLIGASIIYFRGYLVPGTPTLTSRYFPRSVLTLFGKDTDEGQSEMRDDPTDGTLKQPLDSMLLEIGVLEECETDDDLCLTDTFRNQWRDRIEGQEGTVEPSRFARLIGVDPDRVSVDDGLVFVRTDPSRQQQWASRAAVVADVAAAPLLRERVDEWDALALEVRKGVLEGLRIFLDRCPLCRGPIGMDQEETTIGCCMKANRYIVRCENCEGVLMRTDPDPS